MSLDLFNLAASLTDEGLDARGEAFDVTDPAAIDAAAERIERTAGPVDILVNNAGVQLRKPIADWSPEDWHRIMAPIELATDDRDPDGLVADVVAALAGRSVMMVEQQQ